MRLSRILCIFSSFAQRQCKPTRPARGELPVVGYILLSFDTCIRAKPDYASDEGIVEMGKREDLIARYAEDLKQKCGMDPDMDLLTKVTIGCGPSIYNADSATIAASQPGELDTVKKNFLVKKLGLSDGPELGAALDSVIETYGKSERNKYRAVVYYMLTKHFGKEAIYG